MTTGETMYLIDDNGGSEIYFVKCLELGGSWFAYWCCQEIFEKNTNEWLGKRPILKSYFKSQLENEADTFFWAKRDFSSIRV